MGIYYDNWTIFYFLSELVDLTGDGETGGGIDLSSLSDTNISEDNDNGTTGESDCEYGPTQSLSDNRQVYQGSLELPPLLVKAVASSTSV